MKRLVLFLALALSTTTFAEPPKWGFDVSKALLQAGKENKLTFILAGNEGCINCKNTKALINEGKVPVTAETFVFADIDANSQKSYGEFERKFKKIKFGNVLPFVVITDSKGKVLANYSGMKQQEALTKIIEDAKASAGAAPVKK